MCSDLSRPDHTLELTPQTQDVEMLGGEEHLFPIDLDTGQFLDIAVEQHGVDVLLALFDPSGTRIHTADRPTAREGPERLQWIAEAPGSYRLLACAFGNDSTQGHYSVQLANLHEPNAQDRLAAEASRLIPAARADWRSEDPEIVERGIQRMERALEIAREQEDRSREIETRLRLGYFHTDRSRPKIALEFLVPLSQTLEHSRLKYTSVRVLISIARCHVLALDSTMAEKAYKKALELAEKSDLQPQIANIHRNLGYLFESTGDYTKAIDSYDNALDRWQNLGNEVAVHQTLFDRGYAYRFMDQLQQARDDFERALSIQKSREDLIDQARTLTALGDLYKNLGEPEKARTALLNALEIYEIRQDYRSQGVALANLSSLLYDLGDYEKALEMGLESAEITQQYGNKSQVAHLALSLGIILNKLQRSDEALEHLYGARELFTESGHRIWQAEALLEIASIHRDARDLSQARTFIEEAVASIENDRLKIGNYSARASYFDTRRKHYSAYIDILMQMSIQNSAPEFAAEAYAISERSLARTQLEALIDSRLHRNIEEDPALFEKKASLETQISAKVKEHRGLLASGDAVSSNRIERELRSLLREFGKLQTTDIPLNQSNEISQSILDSSEAQRVLLDQETMLLEFHLGNKKSYMWALTHDSLQSFELPPRKVLVQLAKETHSMLSQGYKRRLRSQNQALLNSLSETLLKPLANTLEKRKLLIVADDALHYIPFGALPHPNSSQGEPLLSRHEIVHIPSASVAPVLRQNHQKRTAPIKDLLLVADPIFSLEDPRAHELKPKDSGSTPQSSGVELSLERLAFSYDEAVAILDAANAEQSTTLLGVSAQKNRLLSLELGEYRILHFATHSEQNREHPELSRLILSQFDETGEWVDNYLFAHQIRRLDLNADLVVLSACQTALGRELRGEGLVGLPQAFMYAGAKSVIVSLWNVDDQATADLMSTFYDLYLTQGWPAPKALRQAQDQARRERPEPYYWAAFVFQGI